MVVADDAWPGGLVGRAEFLDDVVIGVGDVGASRWIQRLHDEVEQVAIRAWRQAENAQVAYVANVHRRRRDLGRGPGCAARAQGQVGRLGSVEVPRAGWRVVGG